MKSGRNVITSVKCHTFQTSGGPGENNATVPVTYTMRDVPFREWLVVGVLTDDATIIIYLLPFIFHLEARDGSFTVVD